MLATKEYAFPVVWGGRNCRGLSDASMAEVNRIPSEMVEDAYMDL